MRISYVDATLPKRLRQEELKEVYSFTCQCKLCTSTETLDPREALWCPKGCGGICPHPTEGAVDFALLELLRLIVRRRPDLTVREMQNRCGEHRCRVRRAPRGAGGIEESHVPTIQRWVQAVAVPGKLDRPPPS